MAVRVFIRRASLPCVVASVLALVACAPPRGPDAPHFDAAAAAQAKAQLEPGAGTIKGSAFLRRPTGNFVTAGGEWVYLIPATPYAEDRFKRLYGDQAYRRDLGLWQPMETPQPGYTDAMRKMKARRDGSFRFEAVKPGRYFVATNVQWDPHETGVLKGGFVYDIATVKGDETVEVILSGR